MSQSHSDFFFLKNVISEQKDSLSVKELKEADLMKQNVKENEILMKKMTKNVFNIEINEMFEKIFKSAEFALTSTTVSNYQR